MIQSDIVKTIIEQKKQGKKIIGCFPLYPPVELFESMGLMPLTLWNLKASIQDLAESDKHVQNYSCGIARELVQFVLSDTGELLDGIFSYNACDTLRNLPEILALGNKEAGRNIPMLRMHLPQVKPSQVNPDGYLKNGIALLVEAAENAFGIGFSEGNFVITAKNYRRMRNLCLDAEQLVARGALSFGSFCSVVLTNYVLPVEEQIKRLEGLIAGKDADNPPAATGVMVSGIMPPPAAVVKAMEKSNLRVVANDIGSLGRSYGYSPEITTDPGDYYAELFAKRRPCTTLLYGSDRRIQAFLDTVKRSRAKGVVFSGEKFCEYEYFEFPYLEKRLKEEGVPALFLEFSVDDTDNVGAYSTRVEAFAEMLGKIDGGKEA